MLARFFGSGQDSLRGLGPVAGAVTRAARGPGAESRAADRSPARRDASGAQLPILQLIAIPFPSSMQRWAKPFSIYLSLKYAIYSIALCKYEIGPFY